ncbi:hypothetical protein IH575_04585 [Candidatus Dojkabacteria bacterium]|nr:hypothetical protein [Candidatus Dojkabacteria bacterium]
MEDKVFYVVNWNIYPPSKIYVTKRSPDYKPYTPNPFDKDCRRWKTRKAAEKYLSRISQGFAADCVIEEIV